MKDIFTEWEKEFKFLWSLVEDISDDGDGEGDNLQLTKEGLEAHRMIEQLLEEKYKILKEARLYPERTLGKLIKEAVSQDTPEELGFTEWELNELLRWSESFSPKSYEEEDIRLQKKIAKLIDKLNKEE